jgi:hypothetical protein
MTAELQIPDEYVVPIGNTMDGGWEAVAVADVPLIVADELRAIADAYDAWHTEAAEAIRRGERSHKGQVRSYHVRDQLRARADELTGTTS